jgi:hypothetical protein
VPKDINKQKSQALFSVLGLQSSKGLNNLGSGAIKYQNYNVVNTRIMLNMPLRQAKVVSGIKV